MSYSIEIFRVLCTFFIVQFHTNPIFGKQFFYSGLIFFVFVSIYLNLKKKEQGLYLKNNFNRLIVPWIIWCFIYAVGNKVIHGYFFTVDEIDLFTLLRGSKTHLWYLPFMFTILVIVNSQRKTDDLIVVISCLLLYIFMMFLTPIWRQFSVNLPEPFPQYFHILPAVFASLAISKSSKENIPVVITALLISTFFSINFKGIFVPYLTGLIMFSFVLTFPFFSLKKHVWVDLFSKQSMGIYLIHPAFIHFFDSIKISVGWCFPFLIYFSSFVFIIGVKRFIPYANKAC